jgi:hypothetical protein
VTLAGGRQRARLKPRALGMTTRFLKGGRYAPTDDESRHAMLAKRKEQALRVEPRLNALCLSSYVAPFRLVSRLLNPRRRRFETAGRQL